MLSAKNLLASMGLPFVLIDVWKQQSSTAGSPALIAQEVSL